MRRWETLQARENESTWSPQHCMCSPRRGASSRRLGSEPQVGSGCAGEGEVGEFGEDGEKRQWRRGRVGQKPSAWPRLSAGAGVGGHSGQSVPLGVDLMMPTVVVSRRAEKRIAESRA